MKVISMIQMEMKREICWKLAKFYNIVSGIFVSGKIFGSKESPKYCIIQDKYEIFYL